MAINSKIEWTHHTANLWWGCTNVHEGCDNCYAERWANRYGLKFGDEEHRREVKSVWGNLLGMQAKAAAAGEVHRVFVGSMMDIFERSKHVADRDGFLVLNEVGHSVWTDDLRQRFFREIVPNSPNLIFLLLTKRPSNINKYIPVSWKQEPPKNIMFGATVVNDKTAYDVKRHMDKVNGCKFYSVEPQLGFIDFGRHGLLDGINWLIQGGESGPNKRPFNTDWARHTRDVCADRNVAYFFKQIDKIQPIPDDLAVRQFSGIF